MSSNSECEEGAIQHLLEAIKLHFDSTQFTSRLRKCQSILIRKWKDEHSLDLLHHCILENNIVALVSLLNEGYFKPPYEPLVWPYLHLIACLGHRSFITIIVQEMKFQNDAIILAWDIFDKVISEKLESYEPIAPEEKNKMLTPVDIGGIFKHSKCVELLLDYWQFKKATMNSKRLRNTSKSLYASLACQANSPFALRLMLKYHKDEKEALESALRLISPECIDVILRDRCQSDVKNAFNGMNLFHVLYSYSSCQSLKQYEAMAEVTSVLIRHGQDVNAYNPSRTFPLYSLLNHQMIGASVDDASPCLIAILLLLLHAGADPNFDEIIVENKIYHNNDQYTAYGRRPYSSSICCILSSLASWSRTAKSNASELNLIEKYVYKCTETLLRHGLDLSVVRQFCEIVPDSDMPSQIYHTGSALHVLLSSRSLYSINYPILRLILHYGVNADSHGSWKSEKLKHPLKFALNILPFSVWTLMQANEMRNQHMSLDRKDLKPFTYILKFMSQKSVYKAYLEFQEAVHQLRACKENEEEKARLELIHLSGSNTYQLIVEAYREEMNQPWPLQRCCSHSIWQACRFHMGNVFDLNIPNGLRDVIMFYH